MLAEFDGDDVDDATLIKGQEKVVDEGQDGVKTITYKVTYQDGQEATREVIDEQVTTEMRNKVIAVYYDFSYSSMTSTAQKYTEYIDYMDSNFK